MSIYTIFFGKANRSILEDQNEENKLEIPSNNVYIKDKFDVTNNSPEATTIETIKKSFFSLGLSLRYNCCKCMMKLYYRTSHTFSQNRYCILSNNENSKLKDFNYSELYLIVIKSKCDCEYKNYLPYMSMNKLDIIAKLKINDEKNRNNLIRLTELESEKKDLELKNEELNKEIFNLQKEIIKLKKIDELKYLNDSSPENFYDIIIDINSIRRVNQEGWKVKFNEKGLERYKKYKDEELITIGVIGNLQKGKSFLLNKISKIKFLTGTCLHTQGLSVKYPEVQEHQERKIIILDTMGLENPILRKNDIDLENDDENIDIKENENNLIKDNKINEEENINENEEENQNDLDKNNEQDEEIKLNKENEETENIKAFKENSKDKIMTETFLENFIINVSDILLIVIGELTYSEQLLINKIKDECKQHNKGRVFIVHNLKEFRTVEQVENYINDTLLNCSTFNLKKRNWISNKEKNENKKGNDIILNKNDKEKNKNIIIKNNKNDEKLNQNKNIQIKINEDKEEKNEIKIDNNNNKEQNKEIHNINININKEEKSKIKNIFFSETLKYSDKKIEIYHLILANEDSDAGKFFNQYTYNFIENAYNLISEPKKFDIFDQVKNNFKNLSNIFLNNKLDEVSFTDNKKIINDKVIKLNLKEKLLFKKCHVDELGVSSFKTGSFEPKYNYFKPDENTLEIRLEVPGNTKCDVNHSIEGKYTIINIKGEKNRDKLPKKFEENIVNIRDFSKFVLNIELSAKDFQIQKLKEKYPIFKNGVCIIQYELSSQIDQKTAEPDDEI